MGNRVVLHVMGMDSSKYGGIERFNVELAKTLWNIGLKGVFVYESEPASGDFVKDMEKANGEIIVLGSRKRYLCFCFEFIKLLNKYSPILVHAHFTKACFYAITIAYLKGIRNLFLTIHGEMIPKSQMKIHTRLWYNWSSKVVKVITVSDQIASAYRTNWPKSRVQRAYLGVGKIEGEKTVSRDKLGIPQDQMVLLSVSNFNWIKGLDVLCGAMKVLMDRGELKGRVCLYIVGQPEGDMEELRVLIEQMKIQQYVCMIGISNDVAAYMVSSDIYIQPSRSEGIGLALMEAASASLPLIGTKVGGIPEIVKPGYNGILVDSGDKVMLADAIGTLVHEKGLRKKLGDNSFMLYQNGFSVEMGVNQTISYYELNADRL